MLEKTRGALPHTPRSPRGRGAGPAVATLPCLRTPGASIGRYVSIKEPIGTPQAGPPDCSLTLTSLGMEQGSRGRGIPQPRRGEDMPRKPLDACGMTHAYGSGVGNEGSVATVGPSPRASRRRVRGVGQSPTVLAERSEESSALARAYSGAQRPEVGGMPSGWGGTPQRVERRK